MRVCGYLLALLIVSADASYAASSFKGCFKRDYDKAFLKKNKDLFVTNVEIDAKPMTDQETGQSIIAGKMRFKLRDNKDQWWTVDFECADSGPSWACGVPCDGSSFVLSPGKKGLQLMNRTGINIVKDTCGGEETRKIQADASHDTFVLPKITSKACKK